MENSCPPTPLHVLPGRDSKSPTQMTVSSPESDGMKSPNGTLSPDSRCVICLGKLQKKSFTDSCLHQFCFQCLLQWSKVKPECPLCKQPFKSIIHNVRSNFDYDQYHIEGREPAYVVSEILHSYDIGLVPFDRRFRYRSTMTREYFREFAATFLTRSRSPYELPSFVPPFCHITPSSDIVRPRSERQRQRGVTDYRRNIYEQDLWVQDLIDVTGRYRECSPQFYRDNPAQMHRIIPWLNREVNALLNDNQSQVAYVLDRIVSALPQHAIRSREFREIVEPYFGRRTDHFIHEFYVFARSVYDITGFDTHAVYVTNPNYSTEVQEISSSSDDSDVEVIGAPKPRKSCSGGRGIRNRKKTSRNARRPINSSEPIPGPSGINNGRIEETIELCESDGDDVKVIEYFKPQPEIITLSSGEETQSFGDNATATLPTKKRNPEEFETNASVSSEEQNLYAKKKRRNRERNTGKCKSEISDDDWNIAEASSSKKTGSHSVSNYRSRGNRSTSSSSSSTGTRTSTSSSVNSSSSISTSSISTSSSKSLSSETSTGSTIGRGRVSSTRYDRKNRISHCTEKYGHTSPHRFERPSILYSTSTQDEDSCNESQSVCKRKKRVSVSKRHSTIGKGSDCKDIASGKHKNCTKTAEAAATRPAKVSKVKSCVVIPQSKEISRNNLSDSSSSKYNASHNYSSAEDSYDGTSSILPSYWSLILNEKPKKRKRSKERKPHCKRSKQASPRSNCENVQDSNKSSNPRVDKFLRQVLSDNSRDSFIEVVLPHDDNSFSRNSTSASKENSVDSKLDRRFLSDNDDDCDGNGSGLSVSNTRIRENSSHKY